MKWNLKSLETKLLIGSTLVEGSTLTESESKKILSGKTISGHNVKDVRELLNYQSATQWLIHELQKSPYISKEIILNYHRILFYGFPGLHGVFKSHVNYTYLSNGRRYNFLSPTKVESAIQNYILVFNAHLNQSKKCLKMGSQIYYDFQNIHPFDDGNGRIGRILISYFYFKNGYEFSFYFKDKKEHLEALESANNGAFSLMEKFFKKRIKKIV
jgi:Fic family protein